jgi:hypothetical protein
LKTPCWPGPFPVTPYYPSPSQLCHISPEDGDIMFLQNVGTDLQNYTAPKPKITLALCVKTFIVHCEWHMKVTKPLCLCSTYNFQKSGVNTSRNCTLRLIAML